MEIHRKVIHVKVKLEDLKPSPRKEVKVQGLNRLIPAKEHKTALSLNIPSDSSPRLINLRHSLLGDKSRMGSGISAFEIGEAARNNVKNFEKINQNKYKSLVSSSKPSVSPAGSVVRNSKENLSSSPKAQPKNLEKYSNIYIIPTSRTQACKTQSSSTRVRQLAIKPIINVKC